MLNLYFSVSDADLGLILRFDLLKLAFGRGVSFEKIAGQLSWQGSRVLLLSELRVLITHVFYPLMLLMGVFSPFG